MGTPFKLDEIGPWSEIKLEIIKKYAKAYTTILYRKKLKFYYIDAFAGAGLHKLRTTDEFVPGSPLNALRIKPQFNHYYFIDLDKKKTESLKNITKDYKNVTILSGDCNVVLLNEIFPKIKYEDYRRALCLLDPYGLHLNWEVLQTAGNMKSIEIFLNFPLFDMNRNILWRKKPTKVKQTQINRMNNFWGDETWNDIAYTLDLFDYPQKEKESNKKIAFAFKNRLKKIAGFKYVPEPIPMKFDNKILYYIFFASHNETGAKIAKQIFDKYRLNQ